MKYLQIIIFSILLLNTQSTYSQYHDTGQDPASLKWLQIKTDKFRIIYPESYGNEGILYAKSLDDSYSRLSTIFPEKRFRIPVIIHNYSTESNGYVVWAPRRMELYPTPEQNTIPLGTRSQLAIHELTHVFELVSLNQGFSKVMSFLLGEQFTGITSVMLPLWYFEGHAVFAESFLTESGRGRTPGFQQEFKALALENDKLYKYDMIVNDSYRKYVPSYYQSGYQMVTYALAREGMQIWNKTLDFTAKNPYLLDPANISLSRNARLSKRKLYLETFDTLKTLWNKELAEKKISVYEALNPDKKGEYINYSSPIVIGKDSIIAIKTSLSDPSAFVLLDPQKRTEKRLHTPGRMYPFILSYSSGKIVWAENKPDPRWDNRNYSVIKILYLKTGEIRSLSRKSRYLAASLSPDGSIIAAAENSVNNKNYLVLINSTTGEIIKSIEPPQNAALQLPRWDETGNRITVISLTEEGEAVLSYSINDQTWETLIEYGRDDLQSAQLRNDSLFYIGSDSGTDNVYLKTPDNKTSCLTRSKYGTNDLSLNGNKLIFSNYSAAGYNISASGINDISNTTNKRQLPPSYLINRFDKVVIDTGTVSPSASYNPKPYRKYQHLFRFHSWMPFYADIEEIKADPASVRPGVTLMSQNQLSTLITTAGYEYSENKEHLLHSGIIWKGWYPVFESRIDYGGDPGVLTSGETVSRPPDVKRGFRSVNSINVPLRYASGKFLQYIQPSVSYDYRSNYIYIKEENKFDHGQGLISGRLFISNYFRSSRRDIYPRWAQTVDFNYTFAPLNNSIYAPVKSLKTSFYIPGLLPNNGVKFRFEAEKQGEAKYTLNNKISFPRGYKNIISKDLDFFSVDYVFPLAYPDFNISSLIYLKRIRCSLFGDYANGYDNIYLKETDTGLAYDYEHRYKENFHSLGIEMLADFHVLRLPFMISGGVQAAWKDISEQPVFGILFNIELFGMAINKEPL